MIDSYVKNKAINFIFSLLKDFVSFSYWICLFIAIISTILYVAGLKKAGKYVSVSMVIYFLLECFKATVIDA